LANRALSDAEAALKNNDHNVCVAQLERALFCAIEANSGLAARGILRSDLKDKLVAKGLSADLAQVCEELLARLENARFLGESESPAALISDIRSLVRRLLKAAL
jgi:hypothetical protein